MVARKNPVQPTNCDKRLRKYDTSVQVRRTGVSARRRNPPAAGVMRRSAPRAAVAGAACRDARRRCARTRSSRVCATPHRSPRGSPLRRPRARGRAHGPPFRLSNLGRGTLAVFRRMRGRGSGSRMSDFRRRIRRRSRRSPAMRVRSDRTGDAIAASGPFRLSSVCRVVPHASRSGTDGVPMAPRLRCDCASPRHRRPSLAAIGTQGRSAASLRERVSRDRRQSAAHRRKRASRMPNAGCRHRWREGPFSPPLRFVGRFAQRRNGFEHATAAR